MDSRGERKALERALTPRRCLQPPTEEVRALSGSHRMGGRYSGVDGSLVEDAFVLHTILAAVSQENVQLSNWVSTQVSPELTLDRSIA